MPDMIDIAEMNEQEIGSLTPDIIDGQSGRLLLGLAMLVMVHQPAIIEIGDTGPVMDDSGCRPRNG
ncbi:MAG: hypothetical protein AB7E60_04565 [Sphingobium sp.]